MPFASISPHLIHKVGRSSAHLGEQVDDRLPLIQNADLILMLQDGKLVEQGKHSDLMARNGIYKKIYESQLMIDRDSKKGLAEE